jgi:hypothetical protein
MFARVVIIAVALLATSGLVSPVRAQAAPEPADREPLAFRIFLNDGTNVPTYGEYVRVGEDVVFSMPLGTARPPRLQLITLPAASVNWPRTERYANSARFLRYASTRGEVDYAVLTAEVSATLNEIALTTDRAKALEIAERARRMLMAWPAEHYGYRQNDVREIVALIDESIAELRSQGDSGSLQLSLVAMPPAEAIDTMLPAITPRDQVQRLMTLTSHTPRSAERIALLRAALSVLEDPDSRIERDIEDEARRHLESTIRNEEATEKRYSDLAARLTGDARRAAERAQVSGVERALDEMERENTRLGGKRPDLVQALRAELDLQHGAARELRLRRDRWQVRREVYRSYVNSVSSQVSRLVRAKPAFDEIRRLAGPSPRRLGSLIDALAGGALRLESMTVPEQMRTAHDLLVAAWRFAESALETRQRAINSGEVAIAWQASSAAAGAMLMLTSAQEEMRQVLQFPQLK